MTYTSKLLKINVHRPFPLPERSWKYYQQWDSTFFLHYKIPQEVLWELLPKGLLLDTYQGQAWASVVGFTIKNMRLKFLPPLPYLSDFHEINLRTYVVRDGIPGIYFITIEAGKFINALISRELTGLKYKPAKIKKKSNYCSLTKSREGNLLNLKYLSLYSISEKTELDKWLTERYCAYEEIKGTMYRFNIHHLEWPLKKLKLRKLQMKYVQKNLNIINQKPDLHHFSGSQKVLLWGREKC